MSDKFQGLGAPADATSWAVDVRCKLPGVARAHIQQALVLSQQQLLTPPCCRLLLALVLLLFAWDTGLTVETPHDFDISALIPHRTTCQMSCQEPAADNLLDNPPYAIHQTWGLKLYEKTISPSASEDKDACGRLVSAQVVNCACPCLSTKKGAVQQECRH